MCITNESSSLANRCTRTECRQPGDRLYGKGVARDRVQTHDGARPEPQREGYVKREG